MFYVLYLLPVYCLITTRQHQQHTTDQAFIRFLLNYVTPSARTSSPIVDISDGGAKQGKVLSS